jgi:hypothetical protein
MEWSVYGEGNNIEEITYETSSGNNENAKSWKILRSRRHKWNRRIIAGDLHWKLLG